MILCRITGYAPHSIRKWTTVTLIISGIRVWTSMVSIMWYLFCTNQQDDEHGTHFIIATALPSHHRVPGAHPTSTTATTQTLHYRHQLGRNDSYDDQYSGASPQSQADFPNTHPHGNYYSLPSRRQPAAAPAPSRPLALLPRTAPLAGSASQRSDDGGLQQSPTDADSSSSASSNRRRRTAVRRSCAAALHNSIARYLQVYKKKPHMLTYAMKLRKSLVKRVQIPRNRSRAATHHDNATQQTHTASRANDANVHSVCFIFCT